MPQLMPALASTSVGFQPMARLALDAARIVNLYLAVQGCRATTVQKNLKNSQNR
jgi:hypothetical protein